MRPPRSLGSFRSLTSWEAPIRSRTLVITAALLSVASALAAHELFIKLESYFVAPNTTVRLRILNGTFQTSENAIARDRVADISLVTVAGRLHLDTAAWLPGLDSSTHLTVHAREPGTYVVGASTRPRMIELSAEDFNAYLEHDGIPDVLALRRERGELDLPARERYHKHVKAVFQVGDRRTAGYDLPFGYPAELITVDNPYRLAVGTRLRVRALVDGLPVANQLVFAGGEDPQGLFEERSARTDTKGMVSFELDRRGTWYVRFIHMRPSPEPEVDYESKWATLTFAVR